MVKSKRGVRQRGPDPQSRRMTRLANQAALQIIQEEETNITSSNGCTAITAGRAGTSSDPAPTKVRRQTKKEVLRMHERLKSQGRRERKRQMLKDLEDLEVRRNVLAAEIRATRRHQALVEIELSRKYASRQ